MAGVRAAQDYDLPRLNQIAGQALPPEAGSSNNIEAVMRLALTGDSPYSRAALALIGATDTMRDAKLGARQIAAASEIPISPRQFRRKGSYQDRIINFIAGALAQLTKVEDDAERVAASAFHLVSKISIRLARPEDENFVINLITSALSPYYGGDHKAHAARIFSTHTAGGTDQLGFFSIEQRMFIATLGKEPDAPPLGLIHLVGKRQQTYKISPLIVAPQVRRRLHVGTALLKFAEDYARAANARELYCTVAEENRHALQFFVRNGFVVAGRSDSHYKQGIAELMLYKLLLSADTVAMFDTPNISVTAMTTDDEPQVRALLLGKLPEHFSGIDDAWVDALFAGYSRRNERDVNKKYKLIFVATDRQHNVLGVAAATPKKGEPIKVMPLIATSIPAFSALRVCPRSRLGQDYVELD